jgi:energy-coupling factor transporter ATP-binding protein EcfA2
MPADRGSVTTDMPTGFVFQNPDHQVVMPTVAADVAFGLGRQVIVVKQYTSHIIAPVSTLTAPSHARVQKHLESRLL